MIFLDDLSKAEIEKMLVAIGEKPFRGRQIYKWMYGKNVFDFDKMTDLSIYLREKLNQKYNFRKFVLLNKKTSLADSSMKLLFGLEDGNRIESVVLEDGNRLTGCVSTQVGCRMGCSFCNTGKIGLIRNLTSGEIVRQILVMNSILAGSGKSLSNIVFMGMGEPLDNLQNLKIAIDIILDSDGLNFSHRKVTVSTCGLADELKYLFNELETPVNLAVSLNFADNSSRTKFMPVNSKYNLQYLVETLRSLPVQKRKRITIEYVLLKGINDSAYNARQLTKLLKNLPVKINLISYNASGGKYSPPNQNVIDDFQKILQNSGYSVFLRKSLGEDIMGACGQLYAEYEARD